ncbi:MAG: HAD family hydrolase [Thermoplasmatota archaeon]
MQNRSAAFDFDGTIADWRRGVSPDYRNPEATMKDCYSNPSLRWIAIQLHKNGFQLHVLTGRDKRHQIVLQAWLKFYGIEARIHCRPNHVGLSCEQQADWKASVLKELNPIMYVGDNRLIDEAGARQAKVAFVHVDQAAAALERVRVPQDPLQTIRTPIQELLELLL